MPQPQVAGVARVLGRQKHGSTALTLQTPAAATWQSVRSAAHQRAEKSWSPGVLCGLVSGHPGPGGFLI